MRRTRIPNSAPLKPQLCTAPTGSNTLSKKSSPDVVTMHCASTLLRSFKLDYWRPIAITHVTCQYSSYNYPLTIFPLRLQVSSTSTQLSFYLPLRTPLVPTVDNCNPKLLQEIEISSAIGSGRQKVAGLAKLWHIPGMYVGQK